MSSLLQRIRQAAAAISSTLCLPSPSNDSDPARESQESLSDRTFIASSHEGKTHPNFTVTTSPRIDEAFLLAFSAFVRTYPQYSLTAPLDLLRQRDYTRLSTTGETYVDYMGGALYPESIVSDHARLLHGHTFGNTHSVSNRYCG
jgi:hypothetical protein